MLTKDELLLNYADSIVEAFNAGNTKKTIDILCEMIDHVADYYGPRVAYAMVNSFIEAIEAEDLDQFFFLINAVKVYAHYVMMPEMLLPHIIRKKIDYEKA